jgi:hypothetical protein
MKSPKSYSLIKVIGLEQLTKTEGRINTEHTNFINGTIVTEITE